MPEVSKTLPFGFRETFYPVQGKVREAYAVGNRSTSYWLHFCPQCDGWVTGLPVTRDWQRKRGERGREGQSQHCANCDHELEFVGSYA